MIKHIRHDIPRLERITTDGTRLYQTPSGNAYPSVTTVTGLLNKQSIIDWRNRVGNEEANRISSKAANRGTAIHKLCENFLNNEIVEAHICDVPMWNSLAPLLQGIDNVHALETALYSDHLKVAGTVDCIAEYNGRLSVIDFKTSGRIKRREDISNYFMQCSAYAVAFEERTGIPVDRLVILMAVDNEDPLVFIEKRDAWIDGFKSIRNKYLELTGN